MKLEPREQLIVALDFPTAAEALACDERLGTEVQWVKVGLQLYTAVGPDIVKELKRRKRKIFLDLKLHDIPNTVAGAVRAAVAHEVDLLTLHASGGPKMMEAAVDATAGHGLRLLAVTVLTSLTGDEFPAVYRSTDVGQRVVELARGAADAGVHGIVCSPLELGAVNEVGGSTFLRVTPGIRPAGEGAQDQARVSTPQAALAAGATHLVVGRAITQAADPAEAAVRILSSMQS